MKINGSVTGMESERSFSAVNYSARSFKATEVAADGVKGGVSKQGSFLDTLLGKYDAPEKEETEDTAEEKEDAVTFDDMIGNMSVGRTYRIDVPMRSYSPGNAYVEKMSALYIFSLLFEDFRERIREMMAGCRDGYDMSRNARPNAVQNNMQAYGGDLTDGGMSFSPVKFVRVDYVQSDVSIESEDTKFTAKGKAVCKDGREIEYNINVGMSRRFESYAKTLLNAGDIRCYDPLVINLGGDVTSVSDQNFYFDLDGDGEKEFISSLTGNNGFLALDKNGDGIVNDGTELFGTKTGNGFDELAEYDTDGDGWIDEDDDIFDKLKVWVRDPAGDRLLSLKDAGVGAINLMNSDTEFSLKNEMNKTNAIIRSTGMFLFEDGRAGTLQQIDLAG